MAKTFRGTNFTVSSNKVIYCGVNAIMMMEVVSRSTTQVINKLRGIAQLDKIHTTNGTWDLVAEVKTSNLLEFDHVLRDVRTIEAVLNSETRILLSSV
jgi:DNA-binding Lrp family transcriptional regulator